MFQEENEQKLLRPKEVREMLGGIARSTLNRWRHENPDFPSRVKIEGITGYWKKDVVEFAEKNMQEE